MTNQEAIKCRQCGCEFTPVLNQIYCSEKCRVIQNRKKGELGYPSITFSCAKCGRVVVTEGKKDKRSRFCSPECEKKYWRHPPYEHPTSNTMFHNVGDYLSYERRSNKKESGE